jgi:hypothetical protein
VPFQFRTYLRALVESLRIPSTWTPARLAIVAYFYLIFPWVELFNAACLALDGLFQRGYRQVPVRAPVFIVGNARSGTTLLHRIMSLDSERFRVFEAWDLLLPAAIQKRALAGARRLDRAVGRPVGRWLERLQGRLLGRADTIHRLRLDAPEEDELLFMHCFATALFSLLFPVLAVEPYRHFDALPERKRGALMAYYRGCVQRLLLQDSPRPPRQLLSKNVMFAGKLGSIREAFEGARLVYVVRNPYESVASLHSMVERLWGLQLRFGGSSAYSRTISQGITATSLASYALALGELDRWDGKAVATVRYEDLIRDPVGTVTRIYEQFGFSMSDGFQARLEAAGAEVRGYRSGHVYELKDFGVSEEEIYRGARDVFARFGLDDRGLRERCAPPG